jgi:RNA polymerase sigma-32 factor
MLSSRTSLDRYRTSLHHVEPLSAEEERALAIAWRDGDASAGRRLVEASLPFVIRIAREYRRWGVPFEDLIQQGNLGLLKAAQKFEPDRECRLITYAVYWIRAEIRDYVVRSYRIVRLGTTRTERRAMRAYRRTAVETAEELAETSGMPIARAQKLWPLLAGGDVSLDQAAPDRTPAIDRIRANFPTPEEEAGRRDEARGVRARLGHALGKLSDRERRIVEARFLGEETVTLEQLGNEMGVSKERVRQLEERVCKKLRGELADFRPAA